MYKNMMKTKPKHLHTEGGRERERERAKRTLHKLPEPNN